MKQGFLRFFVAGALLCLGQTLAYAQDVCSVLGGSVVIGQDPQNTFLGKVSSEFDSDSLFNQFGTYGNKFSAQSIWSEFSAFGNKFNSYSPFNSYSSSPPMLVKNGQVIGFLTTNKSLDGAVSPNLLRAACYE